MFVFSVFRFGHMVCPVCMGDPQDPLCLSCNHIYCVACIKQWLVPGQMYCPLCMQPVEENFPLVPSNEMRWVNFLMHICFLGSSYLSCNLFNVSVCLALFRIRVSQHAQFRKRCNAFFIDLVSTVCFKDNSPPSSAVIFHLLSFLMVEASPAPLLRGTVIQIYHPARYFLSDVCVKSKKHLFCVFFSQTTNADKSAFSIWWLCW